MIYQLNNETHWEISPACMREVIEAVDARIGADEYTNNEILIELCNLRAAFESELNRLADKARVADKVADNYRVTNERIIAAVVSTMTQEADPNADLCG